MTALAAIDIALWDIEGKRLGGSEVQAPGGRLRLVPPAFTVDIAGRLRKR